MGVAFGQFFPTEGYEDIRHECINNHADQTHLHLSIVSPTGEAVPCADVAILDQTPSVGPGEMQVEALGIGYPLYEQLFPMHVAAYERIYKSKS